MEQEEVWDAVAHDWADFRTKSVNEVVEFLEDKSGSVLDLGCGSGRNFIKSDDLKIYGVDFSRKLLEIAKEKNYVELKKGFTYDIPYENEFFDYIIFVRVLHCVETEEKRRKTLEEIYRVLKKGGEAVISVIGHNNQRVKNKPKESILPWTVNGVKYGRYNYIYEKDEIEKLVKSVGFGIEKSWEDKNIYLILKK